MRHAPSAVAAALLVALTAGAAVAAENAPAKQHPKMAFEAIDANKDGTVTKDELKTALANHPRANARSERMFGRIDANKDGKIDKAEFDAWQAKRKEHRQHKQHKQDKQG